MSNKELTGYPSIDKPWLKYYSEEAINAKLPECSVYEYLWESNKDYLDNVAISYFDREISFGQLFDEIEKSAKAFSSIGIQKGDVIIMATVTTPETIYAFYALNRLGAIANMVDPRTSVEGIKEYIEEVDAKYVLTIDVAYPKIQKAIEKIDIKKVIVVSAGDSLPGIKKALFTLSNQMKGATPKLEKNCVKWRELIKQRAGQCVFPSYEKDKCCVIEHTGGTTGMPKGVMLSNDNFNSAAFQIKNSPLRLKRQDKFFNIMPPFIAYGMVLGVHIALTHGWKSILIPKFDLEDFSNLLLKYKPAGTMGVPTYFEGLMDDPKLKGKDLSHIKVVLVGGDKTLVEFEKKVNAFFAAHNADIHLSKGYSMTEASATATFSFEEINKAGSAGIPFAQTIVTAFEPETDKGLKVGETGEICISTPTMMLGYYAKEAETKFVLKKHSDGRVWIHSGDLGHVDEDGCVYIDGRLKRMIIRYDGFKVFPSFIENVVSEQKDIETCCAVGTQDTAHSQGKLPVVYAVLKHDCENERQALESELAELCKNELPEYAQPVAFKFVEKMPLTPIGKVDYRALEDMENESHR